MQWKQPVDAVGGKAVKSHLTLKVLMKHPVGERGAEEAYVSLRRF